MEKAGEPVNKDAHMTSDYFRVVAPHFVADGKYLLEEVPRVLETAPIIHYFIGWSKYKVKSYCEQMGWKYEEGL